MLRALIFLVTLGARALRAMCRRRADLVIENLALRQQLTALKKERPRPPLEDVDRAFWVALRESWPAWASRRGRVHQSHGYKAGSHVFSQPMAKRNRGTLDRKLPARAPRARRGLRQAPFGPACEVVNQLLPQGSLPLRTRKRYAGRETDHAATVTHGEGRRAAEGRWTASSIRMARGCLKQKARVGLR